MLRLIGYVMAIMLLSMTWTKIYSDSPTRVRDLLLTAVTSPGDGSATGPVPPRSRPKRMSRYRAPSLYGRSRVRVVGEGQRTSWRTRLGPL